MINGNPSLQPDARVGVEAQCPLAAAERPRPAVRIVFAEKQSITLAGLRAAVADEPSLTIVGEARNGQDALLLVERLRPDLVILNVGLADWGGIDALATLRNSSPGTRVLILSMLHDGEELARAIRTEAAGYILGTSTLAEVREAIWEALLGDPQDQQAPAFEMPHRLPNVSRGTEQRERSEDLTARELEVLTMLANGNTNRQIADALIIMPSTVKKHIEHIFVKLDVTRRTAAAVRALELGHVGRTHASART